MPSSHSFRQMSAFQSPSNHRLPSSELSPVHIRPISSRQTYVLFDYYTRSLSFFDSARTHEREFDRDGQIVHLDNAITHCEDGLRFLSLSLSRNNLLKPHSHLQLARLYKRRLDQGSHAQDLDKAIENYETGEECPGTLWDSFFLDPVDYFDLATLYERRFVREDRSLDLTNAITNQEAGIERLEESDSRRPDHLFKLAHLYEQRSDRDGGYLDIRNAIESQEAGLKLLGDRNPDKPIQLYNLMRMRTKLNELSKEFLLADLQQLANYIRKPKSDGDIVDLMVSVITTLKENDADRLCSDIRDHSIRLGTYCEALRCQLGESMDRTHLRALYEEIVTTEREISASYKNIAAKYERMYKLWREKREQISNMLSLLDSTNTQSYAEDVHARIKQVDEGFENIRRAIDDQGRALKDYFNVCKAMVTSTNRHGDPSSRVVSPDNPRTVSNLPVFPPDPSGLGRVIDVGKERLSQVGTVVGKARYTKTRNLVEEHLSTTASQLEELRRGSHEYESKVHDLSVALVTHQVKWWNRWRGPYHQLPNLVKSMGNRLTEIQRGFNKCKHSLLGLIFRPLGDVIDELKSYFSQAGQEVVRKGLHPDMILYEAAFLFLIKTWSRPLDFAEQIDECNSRLEATVCRV
ncbi:hypothetical protein FRC18_011237 [Serendipita sp. 400]|nr:hypothetical protein FRC18_011237 [Serendipita sp. 400]